jgi:hypothetical protein
METCLRAFGWVKAEFAGFIKGGSCRRGALSMLEEDAAPTTAAG